MSVSDKIIKEIDMLSKEERQKVLDKIKEKYMSRDVILLSNTMKKCDFDKRKSY